MLLNKKEVVSQPYVKNFTSIFLIALSTLLVGCSQYEPKIKTNSENRIPKTTQNIFSPEQLKIEKQRMLKVYVDSLRKEDEIEKTNYSNLIDIELIPDSADVFDDFYKKVGAPARHIENYKSKYLKTNRFILLRIIPKDKVGGFNPELLSANFRQSSIPDTLAYVRYPNGNIVVLFDDFKIEALGDKYNTN